MDKKATKQEEIRIREGEVIKRIRKGWSRMKLIDYAMKTFDIKLTTAQNLVRESFSKLAHEADVAEQQAKGIQVERIEALLTEALESQDRKTAVKALDMLNKIYNLYSTKAEIQLNGKELKFSFGEEEENDGV